MAITLPADGWVRNVLGRSEPGRFHCINSFKYLGPSDEVDFHLLVQDVFKIIK